ncbi:MAG: hypothetical protein Q7T76_08185 [Ferruginibacter sp.]|nr:hypothetical protein [Ferruginibacter sp.]
MKKYWIEKYLLKVVFVVVALLYFQNESKAQKRFFRHKIDSEILRYYPMPRFKQIVFTYERKLRGGKYYFYLVANAFDSSNVKLNDTAIKVKIIGSYRQLIDHTPDYNDITLTLTKAVMDSNGVNSNTTYSVKPVQTIYNTQYCVSYEFDLFPKQGFTKFYINPAPPF